MAQLVYHSQYGRLTPWEMIFVAVLAWSEAETGIPNWIDGIVEVSQKYPHLDKAELTDLIVRFVFDGDQAEAFAKISRHLSTIDGVNSIGNGILAKILSYVQNESEREGVLV